MSISLIFLNILVLSNTIKFYQKRSFIPFSSALYVLKDTIKIFNMVDSILANIGIDILRSS